MTTEKLTTKVVTGKVRFSYANVFEPTAMDENATPKYNISIIVDKEDKSTLAKIQKAIDAAIKVGSTRLGDKNGKINKATLKTPLRDGDIERPDDAAYKNAFFFNASATRQPGIVDANLDPIMSADEFYSGCFGRASVDFYAFNKGGSRGVAVGLNNLQKLEDGERLDGRSAAEDDFADELM